MKKSILLGYLFITFVLILSNISNSHGNLGTAGQNSDMIDTQQISNQVFIADDPIGVNGDEDLRSQAISEGWDLGGTQDGSFDFPFQIRDYVFGGYPKAAININHTSLHVLIYANSIDSKGISPYGIYMRNVTNVRIQSNTIIISTNLGIGIELRDSQYNDIWLNNINGKSVWWTEGIELHNSNFTQFRGNTLYDLSNGIVLSANSKENWISSTEIYGTANIAIYIGSGCQFNTLRLNNFHDTNGGIFIQSASSNYLTNNVIQTAYNGIYMFDGSFQNRFRNNTLESNTNGITLDGSANNNNIFYANLIQNSANYGIKISTDSNENTISWNNFIGNNGGEIQGENNGSNNLFINNHFDDQTSPDIAPRDDFVDDPYLLDGSAGAFNYDRYPLRKIYSLQGGQFIYPINQETIVGEITVSWNPLIDNYGNSMTYRVYYSSDGGFTTTLVSDWLSITSFQWDTTLVENSRRAKLLLVANTTNGVGIGLFFSGVFFVDNHGLTQPEIINLPISKTLTGIYDLTWTASEDSKGHSVFYNVSIIELKGDGQEIWELIGIYMTVTKLAWDSSTHLDGIYFIVIVAFDDFGITSDSERVEIKIDNFIETSSSSGITTTTTTTTSSRTSTSTKSETKTDESSNPSLPIYSPLYLWIILPTLILFSLRSSKSRREK